VSSSTGSTGPPPLASPPAPRPPPRHRGGRGGPLRTGAGARPALPRGLPRAPHVLRPTDTPGTRSTGPRGRPPSTPTRRKPAWASWRRSWRRPSPATAPTPGACSSSASARAPSWRSGWRWPGPTSSAASWPIPGGSSQASSPAPPAQALSGLEVLVQHGGADDVVPVERGRESRDLLAPLLGERTSYREYDLGHSISEESWRTRRPGSPRAPARDPGRALQGARRRPAAGLQSAHGSGNRGTARGLARQEEAPRGHRGRDPGRGPRGRIRHSDRIAVPGSPDRLPPHAWRAAPARPGAEEAGFRRAFRSLVVFAAIGGALLLLVAGAPSRPAPSRPAPARALILFVALSSRRSSAAAPRPPARRPPRPGHRPGRDARRTSGDPGLDAVLRRKPALVRTLTVVVVASSLLGFVVPATWTRSPR